MDSKSTKIVNVKHLEPACIEIKKLGLINESTMPAFSFQCVGYYFPFV